MHIFVINAGSSSIKYQLLTMPDRLVICSGLVERIGLTNALITHKVYANGQEEFVKLEMDLKDHEAGMLEVGRLLTEHKTKVIQNAGEIHVVGHRVVHGGEFFKGTTLVTPKVKEEIKKLFALAPLHNPSNYLGIEVAEKLFTQAKQVVVFDTAFHQTLPEKAYRMAIPNSFYKEKAIRVYGFHGISHKYVSEQAVRYLGDPEAKIISIHLGNGCSMAAIKSGKCLDTSMGFTPLDGLIMGSRSGNLDPSVLIHLMSLGYTSSQLDHLLNKESGMLGLTGYSDMREIKKALEAGDEKAKLAYEMYAYRIQKYIGAYTAALNGVSAIVFTAGVGENDTLTRELVCRNMDFFSIQLDPEKNLLRSSIVREINTSTSRTKVLVIPTNEEVEIARECFELLGGQ